MNNKSFFVTFKVEVDLLRDELHKVRSHNGRLVAENTKLSDRVTKLEVVLGERIGNDSDNLETLTLPLDISSEPLHHQPSSTNGTASRKYIAYLALKP